MFRRLAALLAIAALSASCGSGITWEHSEDYDNGQFRVLPGNADPDGAWDGPWLWFNRDGSIMYTEVFDGRPYDRTGFYDHGKKIRELTKDELQAEMTRIRSYLRKTGQRMSEPRLEEK